MADEFEKFPWTDPEVTDNGHLETYPMTLPKVMTSIGDLQGLIAEQGRTITAHGQRHSQGGQSLMPAAYAVDLDLLQGVEIHPAKGMTEPYVAVQAGATWDRLHRKLHQFGGKRGPHYAPCTHQSSPFFSIGGSLAVNCHGRDPRQGPVANSVTELTVLMPNGEPKTVARGPHNEVPELMAAVLGGYGGCGLIVSAKLKLKPELILGLKYGNGIFGGERIDLPSYCRHVQEMMSSPTGPSLPHHFAWLSCGEEGRLMTQVLSVDGVEMPEGNEYAHTLDEEGLLNDDMLSAVYHQYRLSRPDQIGEKWPALVDQISLQSKGVMRQLNAMRAPVRFTQSMPYEVKGTKWVDLMQEYFVPPHRLQGFIEDARVLLADAQDKKKVLKVLTSTVRALQADCSTMLNYARSGPRCSVVINFGAPLEEAQDFEGQGPLPKVLRDLIVLAIAKGGAYYPCYGRFATTKQFAAAFGEDVVAQMKIWRKQFDPDKKFNNRFLETYLNF